MFLHLSHHWALNYPVRSEDSREANTGLTAATHLEVLVASTECLTLGLIYLRHLQ